MELIIELLDSLVAAREANAITPEQAQAIVDQFRYPIRLVPPAAIGHDILQVIYDWRHEAGLQTDPHWVRSDIVISAFKRIEDLVTKGG